MAVLDICVPRHLDPIGHPQFFGIGPLLAMPRARNDSDGLCPIGLILPSGRRRRTPGLTRQPAQAVVGA